jgi:hypothetical protein
MIEEAGVVEVVPSKEVLAMLSLQAADKVVKL